MKNLGKAKEDKLDDEIFAERCIFFLGQASTLCFQLLSIGVKTAYLSEWILKKCL